MNSILQCLFASSPLTEYFLNTFKSDKKLLSSYKIANAYSDLLNEARNSRGGSVAPNDLKN
jgi:ubiquitin C-terminal hydrolase